MTALPCLSRGFAALVSTLVIGTSLLVLALSASAGALMTRIASLETSHRAEARLRAYACAQAALFELAADLSYRPSAAGDTVELAPGYSCRIDGIAESEAKELLVDTSGAFRGFAYRLRHTLAPSANGSPPFELVRAERLQREDGS